MLLPIPGILDQKQLKKVREILNNSRFVDGRLSAGLTARKVKNNEEIPQDAQVLNQLNHIVMNALYNHPVFQAGVIPHRVATPFYARYGKGQYYGDHVDDPIMGPMNGRYRTDVSTTVFLNEPDEYAGGETVIHTQYGERKVKLAAGDAITYPSGSLHHVAEVTDGTRLVAVTWTQSMVRDPAKRELLYELYRTRDALQKKMPDDEETTRLDHTYINLMRMWAEI
ncbi:MAG: Fe2+-dependent dioxygenase [Gammaproteobacteria bacterium]|nr:Fe2+-dependent dioxygenase [Gammaproteobacteria bacterium]